MNFVLPQTVNDSFSVPGVQFVQAQHAAAFQVQNAVPFQFQTFPQPILAPQPVLAPQQVFIPQSYPQQFVPQVVYTPVPQEQYNMSGLYQYPTSVPAPAFMPQPMAVPVLLPVNNQTAHDSSNFSAPSYIQPVSPTNQATFCMGTHSGEWVQNTTPQQTFVSGEMQADGGEGSEASDVLLWTYKFQKSVGTIAEEFGQEGLNFEAYAGRAFVRALQSTARDPDLYPRAFAQISESESTSQINFFCAEQEFGQLSSIVLRGDFEERIKAELGRDTHLLNTHITGIKQTIISVAGWDIAAKLLPTMTNKDCELLREIPQQEQFSEESKTMFYKVLDPKKAHDKGSALRGDTCVVVRPKKKADLFQMSQFLDEVMQQVEIYASSIIVSLKAKQQNKGYSIYLDVGSRANVDIVFQIGEQQRFEGAKVTLAPDCDKN